MVAHALSTVGVQLGRDDELLAPASDNPQGFFERVDVVAIDEALLGELSGAWDAPPAISGEWWRADRLGHLRAEAEAVGARFAGAPAWAIKDPRMSVLLDFWYGVLGPAPTLVCVRHPLEVALSLNRRNGISYALGLQLWSRYHSAIDAATRDRGRVVTHYAAWLPDDSDELDRVAQSLGLAESPGLVPSGNLVEGRVVDRQLRHGRMGWTDLRDAGVSSGIMSQYLSLCQESGWLEPDGPGAGSEPAPSGGSVASVGSAHVEPLPTTDQVDVGQLNVAAIDHADLLHRFHVRGGYIAILERRLSEADATVAARDSEVRALRAEVDTLLARPQDDPQVLVSLLEGLALDVAAARPMAEDEQHRTMRAAADRWRRDLHSLLPAEAPIVVVGRTDLLGRVPGRNLVEHVRADTEVGVELDRLEGVANVVIAGGWEAIGARPALAHALRHFAPILDTGDLVVLSLEHRITSVPRRIVDAIDAGELRTGRQVSVLDLTPWVATLPLLADRRVFVPSPPGSHQHLLDGAVDVILADPSCIGDESLIRLATDSLVAVTDATVDVMRASSQQGRIPIVSVVVTEQLSAAALDVLRDSLPEWVLAELVMPGDRTTDDSSYGVIRRWIDTTGLEGVARTNSLMAAADGEIVVVIDRPVVPERGWLAPLVDALIHPSVELNSSSASASIAAPMVLQPDNTLLGLGYLGASLWGAGLAREASGVVAHRRAVDAVTGPVLAITRAAFAAVGGLDIDLDSNAAWVALCAALTANGHMVLAVPESVVVLPVAAPVPTLTTTAVETANPTVPVPSR